MDARIYWCWLQLALPPGNRLAGPLLERFGGAGEIYEAGEGALREAEIPEPELTRLLNKELGPARRLLAAALALPEGWVMTPDDAGYPLQLRELDDLPLLLHGLGTMPPTEYEPCIGMVGTRKAREIGMDAAYRIGYGLAAGGMTVVSGGAVGIDGASLTGALDAGGRVVSIQACGLDVDYPAENRELRRRILKTGGMLISEYPPGTPPLPHHFPVRNRLISGMAAGVCVVEAGSRSGALITASHAREQGRDVFAVPGEILTAANSGSNRLIKQGARLVDSAVEILEEYRWRFSGLLDFEEAERARDVRRPTVGCGADRTKKPPSRADAETSAPGGLSRPPERKEGPERERVCPDGVTGFARTVYELLEEQPLHIDELAALSGQPASLVLAALTQLEIAGCAAGESGQRYRRT